MKMHPFLKHRVLSQSMRDLLYHSKFNRLNRPKRLDLYYPTSTELATRKQDGDSLNPLFLAIRRSVNETGSAKGCDLLGTVLKDIQEIRYGKMLQTDEECVINGSWTAEVAGRRIEISDKSGGVKLRKPLQKRRRGVLGLDPWNATIKFPFKRKSNYIILTATNDKDKVIATFMGECRVCRSKPIVQGQWLIARHSRDCEGLGATEKLIGDVWRKEKLCEMKDYRLDKLKNAKKQHVVKNITTTAIPTCKTL